MILIVSAAEDVHATAVGECLDVLGADWRIVDLRDFPARSELSLEYGRGDSRHVWRFHDREIDLTEVESVWWRRPQEFCFDDELICPQAQNFAYRECEEAINGLWATLDANWINDPGRDERASHKVWQLQIAERCGLRVPRTLISNDPTAVRSFVDREQKLVYKPFQGSLSAWRETRLVGADEREKLGQVSHAPVIFQSSSRPTSIYGSRLSGRASSLRR